MMMFPPPRSLLSLALVLGAAHAQRNVDPMTIVVGEDDFQVPSRVGWTDGVCYEPITNAMGGDTLVFEYQAHNVYQMASKEHFMSCNFTDATLLSQVGESPFRYDIPEDATDVLYFACRVGDHCNSGTQKLQVIIAAPGFWDDSLRLPLVSGYVVGGTQEECQNLQANGASDQDVFEQQRLLSNCSDPILGDDGYYTRNCLSAPATLTPGGVINRLFMMHYPYPKDKRVAIGQTMYEFVHDAVDGEGVIPTPIDQLYIHHLSGNVIFGIGAEGLRLKEPDAPFPEPYTKISGNELEFMIFHLIDLRQVDDWLACIECRCPVSENTYFDDLTNTGNITGGINCCSNCTDLTGPTLDYRMRYNISYRDLDDEPVKNVVQYTADISPAVDKMLEHDVPSSAFLPQDQVAVENPFIQRLERVAPFKALFQDGFFSSDYSGPDEVVLLRCVAHLHVAAISQRLENAETGETLCEGNAIYGKDPETNAGFLINVNVTDHDPPITFSSNLMVRMVTDYNATEVHTGVMGYWFVWTASEDEVTQKEANLTVDLCIHSTCDASLLPAIDMSAFQPDNAVVARQVVCEDTIEESPSCTFGGLCDCESFVNAPESTGCNGFYSSAFGDVEVRSLCANYCGCDVSTAINDAMSTSVTESQTAGGLSNCKDTLIDNPACRFGGLCDCAEFVSMPETGGCGGTYTTEMGSIVVKDVCAAHCGDCGDLSTKELFEEAYMEVATMSLRDLCHFATAECQSVLSNMYSCAEERPGIEDAHPMIRDFVVQHGHKVALESAILGNPDLHAGQEDQVVERCLGVETSTAPSPSTAPATESTPAQVSPGNCKDTLSSNPACTFGGMCDCETMVNSPEVVGDGCNGIFKNSFGEITILSVCARYCGCPEGATPEVSGSSGLSMCFSGDSTVEVLGRGTTAMKHLSIGDQVLTGSKRVYEPVYGFAHLHRAESAKFLTIQTAGSKREILEITPDHLVYANDQFVPAGSIMVGDILQAEGGSTVVTKITSGWKKGLYAPLTPSGTLFVNGVKVSSYVTLKKDANSQLNLLSQHEFIHMVLSPLRMACMGISADLCSNDHINEQTGYLPFVGFGIYTFGFIERLHIFLQLVLFCLAFCAFAPMHFAESIVGATLVPGILAAASVAVILGLKWRKLNVPAFEKNLKLKMA